MRAGQREPDPPTAPTLVTVAHGTRVAEGNLVAHAVTQHAARRLGGVPHVASYVELCDPLLGDVMADAERPAVVVPLLLSTGFHVKQDLPEALAASPAPAVMTRPLGPHPLLAEVMCHRLQAAGARAGDPVVLVAAGSQDPDALPQVAEAARLLQARWGAPVEIATVTGRGDRLPEAVERARRHGRVAVAPYLLSTGFFSRRARAEAEAAGAASFADVLGDHPLVTELVVRRYRVALAAPGMAA